MKRRIAIACVLGACAKSHGMQTTPARVDMTSSGETHVYRTSVTGTPLDMPGDHSRDHADTPRGAPHRNDALVGGLITLGVSYVSTVVGGQVVEATLFGEFDRMVGAPDSISLLWFPVFGAWAGLIHNETTVRSNCEAAMGNCDMATVGSIAIGVGAIAQTTGLAITLYGLLKPPPFHPPVHRSSLAIIPHGSSDSVGLTAIGRF